MSALAGMLTIVVVGLVVIVFVILGALRLGDAKIAQILKRWQDRGGAWELIGIFIEGADREVDTLRKFGRWIVRGKWLRIALMAAGVFIAITIFAGGCGSGFVNSNDPEPTNDESEPTPRQWTPPECGDSFGYPGPYRDLPPCTPAAPSYPDPEYPADPQWEGPDPVPRGPQPTTPPPPVEDVAPEKRGVMPGELAPPNVPSYADGWFQLFPEVQIEVEDGRATGRARHTPPNNTNGETP